MFVAPGEVEQVDPAESETHHQEAQILLPPAQVQASCDQEEGALKETNHGRALTDTPTGFMVAAGNNASAYGPAQGNQLSGATDSQTADRY